MEQRDVIAFFDRCAPTWDAEMIRDDRIIDKILEHAGIRAGSDVLDVACGTGVLIPDYLKRGVGTVTGIDLSPEMIKIARSKFAQDNVRLLCGDVETAAFDRRFDCIVIYNAFPHFPEPERLIRTLAKQLRTGGTLTVAHGMSRAAIDRHHCGCASRVSIGLMHEDELASIFGRYLSVTTKISDREMYQVTGKSV